MPANSSHSNSLHLSTISEDHFNFSKRKINFNKKKDKNKYSE